MDWGGSGCRVAIRDTIPDTTCIFAYPARALDTVCTSFQQPRKINENTASNILLQRLRFQITIRGTVSVPFTDGNTILTTMPHGLRLGRLGVPSIGFGTQRTHTGAYAFSKPHHSSSASRLSAVRPSESAVGDLVDLRKQKMHDVQ